MENEKYKNHLNQLDDVYSVTSSEVFIFLDLLFISFFLGFILYSQIHHYLTPLIISGTFFFFFMSLFHFFCKEKNSEKEE